MTHVRLVTLILPMVLTGCSDDTQPGAQLNFVATPIIPRVVSAQEALAST
jgi:hypothetical protein